MVVLPLVLLLLMLWVLLLLLLAMMVLWVGKPRSVLRVCVGQGRKVAGIEDVPSRCRRCRSRRVKDLLLLLLLLRKVDVRPATSRL